MRRYMLHKYIFQLIVCLVILALACGFCPIVQAEEKSGDCGEGLSWSLEGGTLTISGSGDMTDFTEEDMAPWYEYRDDILRVTLPDGLGNVGDLAFYDCENLTAVILPDSVEAVGEYAFAGCADLKMLDLGSNLQTIGEAAFSDCAELRSLELPDSTESIGIKAFYRCESLSTVTVPESVETIGTSSFAYCTGLVSADVQASVEVLPEWMFYGCEYLTAVTLPDTISDVSDHAFRACENLSGIYYDGEQRSTEEIEQIFKDDPNIGNQVVVNQGTPNASVTAATTKENDDGTVTVETVTVTEGENTTVSTTLQHTKNTAVETDGSFQASISVTVNGDDGWAAAQKAVETSLKNLNGQFAGTSNTSAVSVDVYMAGTDTLNRDFVDSMSGRDVSLSVTARDGSSWKMDCADMSDDADNAGYDLRHTIAAASPELCEELETSKAVILRFSDSSEFNVELLVHLGSAWARQNATLFCREGKKLVRHQSVVVDGDGYAHLYLASVDGDLEYYLALNLPDAAEAAILPSELIEEYNAVRYEPIQYELTGRTSSWGLDIGQVTWIMVGVMAFCALAVGFTMYLLNKRRIKSGYYSNPIE